ncbi:MAG: hypothetical protein IJ094_04745 [Bacilli bacterium]|nr:hypothetical protein [Bacilli bacterium]
MITNEDLKKLANYFSDKEIPEDMEVLVKKLNLINQIEIANAKLQELSVKEK